MIREPLDVAQLTEYLANLISADELLRDLWVEGEVLQCVTSRAGHIFFTIGDDDAKLKCVLFRGNALRQRHHPEQGLTVAVHGNVAVYARDGTYQLYVDVVQPAGLGSAALELERLRQRLAAEGLFDPSRKRPIPSVVRTIGVVTSERGAVWHDIQTVVRRRNPFVTLVLSPASVQGADAPASICAALERLITRVHPDVIILGRGGGSAMDLAPFNAESVVRAAFASPVPIVSAVGHETDWSLLDEVADLRAATPTAAAELCTRDIGLALRQSAGALHGIANRMLRTLRSTQHDVVGIERQLVRWGPIRVVEQAEPQIVERRHELARSITHRLVEDRRVLDAAHASLGRAMHDGLLDRQSEHRELAGRLALLSPTAAQRRGFALLTDAQTGQPLRSVTDVTLGMALTASMHDGEVDASVVAVRGGG